jgi:hypothetical protein
MSESKQEASTPTEGWAYLHNSPKWHYFTEDGKSLCGRWMTFGNDREVGKDNSPDNCKACITKLQKRRKP